MKIKNKIIHMKASYYMLMGVLSIILFSCQDVLDKNDLTTLDDRIWEDETQMELYINNLYVDNMPAESFGENAPLSDETFSSDGKYTDLLYGFITPSGIDAVTVLHKDKYNLIRRINIGLEGIQSSPVSDSIKNVLAGQALFLRAYRYWELVQLYGGVSIIQEVQDPYGGADELDVPRDKTGIAIDKIIADLDKAIDGLPTDWLQVADRGRITKGGAAAFKGRILLTWASPMFNPNNDQARWQKAYEANKQAVDLLSQMSVPRALNDDFSTIFTRNILENVESVIFRRYSLGAGNSYTHGWEGSVRPYSGGGSSSFSPTWELVQAFPMANGKLINEPGSGYDETLYWKNRDPRFYATIAYNGSEWSMNGRDITTVWTFRNTVEGNRSPATGFYNRKATDPLIAKADVSQTSTGWHELRYAEVLLNLAECANEINAKNEALDNVRAIRERAGIESGGGEYGISNSIEQSELREVIMVERQVEFAFENKRYWDMRRRKMFREDVGTYVTKLNGRQRHSLYYAAKGKWGREITDPNSPYKGWLHIDTALTLGHLDLNDPASFNNYFSSTVRNLDTYAGVSTLIDYKELYDYFAVPSSMLQKSPAVEQTLGWINGTFDPLAE